MIINKRKDGSTEIIYPDGSKKIIPPKSGNGVGSSQNPIKPEDSNDVIQEPQTKDNNNKPLTKLENNGGSLTLSSKRYPIFNDFNGGEKNSKTSTNNDFNAIENNSKASTIKFSKNFNTIETIENSVPLKTKLNQFEIVGKKGGRYSVTVEGDIITVKKDSTGNTLKGKYSVIGYKTKLVDEDLVKVPRIELGLKADANIGEFVLKQVKKVLQKQLAERENIVEYVKKNFPEEWEAINKDPIAWVLEKSSRHFIGGEKYKIGVLHSIVSSRIKDKGMRVNFLLIAEGGAGKSSSIKSVIDLLPKANWIHKIAKLTPEVLAYMDVRNIDGHILFVEEMDHLEYFRNLKKMLTEGEFTTWATVKDADGRMRKQEITITGIPVFISTTAMLKKWDEEVEQILTRMVTFIFKQDYRKSKRYTLEKEKSEYPESWKLTFYAWLITRPTAKLTKEVIDAIDKDLDRIVDKARGAINRMALIYGQLTIVHAMIYGRTETTMEDYEYVRQNFALELYLNSLLLNERDLEIMKLLENPMRASELASMLHITKNDASKLLSQLMDKGVVDYDVDEQGKKKTYYLTSFGREILSLFEGKVVSTETIRQVLEGLPEDQRCDSDTVRAKFAEHGYSVDDTLLRRILMSWGCYAGNDKPPEPKQDTPPAAPTLTVVVNDPQWWKEHIRKHFDIRPFTVQEFAKTVEGMTAEEAAKILEELYAKGIVAVVWSKQDGTKWYALRMEYWGVQ